MGDRSAWDGGMSAFAMNGKGIWALGDKRVDVRALFSSLRTWVTVGSESRRMPSNVFPYGSQQSVLHIGHWIWIAYPLFFLWLLSASCKICIHCSDRISPYCLRALDVYKTPVSFFGAFGSALLSLVYLTCPTPLKIPFPHAKLAVHPPCRAAASSRPSRRTTASSGAVRVEQHIDRGVC